MRTLRGFGYVMQDIAFFPNMTVYENVIFGSDSQKPPKGEADSRVNKFLSMIHVKELRDSTPTGVRWMNLSPPST
jgi:ABC-type Fe3+/spermidine/putrescine transport system ATPase subunit